MQHCLLFFRSCPGRSAVRYCRRWLPLLFIFLHGAGSGTAQRLPLETYTPANGLLDVRINKMFQDSRGRIFFLTREGFSVFDGQRFENYSELDGVSAELCNDVIENKDHSVSVYSFNGNIFHYADGGVRADTTNRALLTELNKIITIAPYDYLIATNYRLLHKQGSRYTTINIPAKGPQDAYIDNVVRHGPFILFSRWSSPASKKIYLCNYEKGQILDVIDPPEAGSLFTDASGRMYHGNTTWRQLDTAALNKGRLMFTPLWFNKWIPPGFGTSWALQFDREGYIWLLNGKTGCCRIHPGTGNKQYYRVTDGLMPGVNSIFEDRENNYWFIAPGKGVQKLQQSPIAEVKIWNGNPLYHTSGINTGPQGRLFLTADGNMYAGERPGVPQKGGQPIWWQNDWWYFDGYQYITNGRGKRLQAGVGVAGYEPLDYQPAFQASFDGEGRLLLPGKSLYVLDQQYRVTTKRLPYYADNVIVDADGSYWCFMRSNEIWRLQWRGDSLHTVFSTMVHHLNPRFAISWKPGVFAVATRNNGIQFLTLRNGRLVYTGNISPRNGLSNNFVHTMTKRGENELVAGTARGLDIIRMGAGDTVVTRAAAASNIFSSFNMLAQTADGLIYARTDDGALYKLDKMPLPPPDYRPALRFKTISINGEKKDWGTEHRFGFTSNNFRFSVTCPSFLDNNNMQFLFLLQGNRRNWRQQGATADFEINNLEPGSYTMQVSVNYPGRIYPGQTIEYRFTILPPVWKRWWFILLSAVAVAAATFMLVKNYLRRRLEKQRAAFEQQRAVEQERTRIATDMHDDFGAGLSRIKFISEKLLLRHRGSIELKPDLEKISGYSDEMAEKMGEIVWALNQRYDTMGDLVSFCRSYASEYLGSYDIALHFEEAVTERQLKGEIRRNLFLVLKESLHNTVKHAAARSVSIGFKEEGDALHIHIADNGKGIDYNHIRPFSNGLENMKKRVADCGGRIDITVAGGTLIDVVIPLGRAG